MHTKFNHILSLLLTALTLALVLTGCASPEDKAASQLVGTWTADMSGLVIEGMPEDQLAAIQTMLADSVMQMTLNEDGTNLRHTQMGDDIEDVPGTWEVVSVDGDDVTITGTAEDDEEGEAGEERVLTFTGDDSFSMTQVEDGQTMTMPFTRD